MQVARHEAIRHHLYTHGVSSIADIAVALGASLATVRRDLQALEQQGVISRTHGSARIAQGSETEAAFAVRETRNLAAKRAIAQAAYAMIEPHSAIFLDASTTVLQLARRLRLDPLPLTVFTNGLVVAQELMTVPGLKISLLGGQLRVENASLVGPAAEAALHALWFDRLFLGVSAIGDDSAIYSVDAAEANLNALMRQRAAATVVMADSTKFDRRSTHLVFRLGAPVHVLTDDGLPPETRQRLHESGATVTAVAPLDRPTPRLAAVQGR